MQFGVIGEQKCHFISHRTSIFDHYVRVRTSPPTSPRCVTSYIACGDVMRFPLATATTSATARAMNQPVRDTKSDNVSSVKCELHPYWTRSRWFCPLMAWCVVINTRTLHVACAWSLAANMTSSTKPEVDDILQRHHAEHGRVTATANTRRTFADVSTSCYKPTHWL